MHTDYFHEHFQTITDQHQSTKVTHTLFEVLYGSLCAVIAGAEGWFDIREYILGHHEWFKNNDLIINGVPAYDTITRIISIIEPNQFHHEKHCNN